MSDYLKVEGYNNLVRDTKDEIRTATREINNIKCEMHEIKSMLKTLLDKD